MLNWAARSLASLRPLFGHRQEGKNPTLRTYWSVRAAPTLFYTVNTSVSKVATTTAARLQCGDQRQRTNLSIPVNMPRSKNTPAALKCCRIEARKA